MLRVILVAMVASCASQRPGPASSPTPAPAIAKPVRVFDAAPDALAVVHPETAALDDEKGRLFVRRDGGIDVLDLATGAREGRIDLGWDGAVSPAGPYLIAQRIAAPLVLDVAVVDPEGGARIAACSTTVDGAPAGSRLVRVDVFANGGTPFLRWESGPPPRPPRGARMTDAEIASWQREMDAAYACGVLEVSLGSGPCRLDTVPHADGGLDSCDTRRLPGKRALPAALGPLSLRVEEEVRPTRPHPTEAHTFVVARDGDEVWRVDVATRILLPAPP